MEDTARTPGHPIDLDALDAATGGDRELARELFAILRTDAPSQLERIRKALLNGDCVEIRQVAHRLRGSLLTLGVPAAAQIASDLEQQAAQSQRTGTFCCRRSTVDTLETEIVRSIEVAATL